MKCRDSLFVGSGAVARGQTDKTVTRKVVFFFAVLRICLKIGHVSHKKPTQEVRILERFYGIFSQMVK